MTLEDTIEYAIDGGIDMVQLREKELTRDELLRSADKLRSICLLYTSPSPRD